MYLLVLTYYYYIYILYYDIHARSVPLHRWIGLKLWTSLDNVFKERKVLYILHARGFARAFTASAEAPVTSSASSGNPMNTKHDVHAFNNAKPLRFTGASRITLDQLAKYIHLYLATYARVSRVHITYYTGCDSFIVLTPTFFL